MHAIQDVWGEYWGGVLSREPLSTGWLGWVLAGVSLLPLCTCVLNKDAFFCIECNSEFWHGYSSYPRPVGIRSLVSPLRRGAAVKPACSPVPPVAWSEASPHFYRDGWSCSQEAPARKSSSKQRSPLRCIRPAAVYMSGDFWYLSKMFTSAPAWIRTCTQSG